MKPLLNCTQPLKSGSLFLTALMLVLSLFPRISEARFLGTQINSRDLRPPSTGIKNYGAAAGALSWDGRLIITVGCDKTGKNEQLNAIAFTAPSQADPNGYPIFNGSESSAIGIQTLSGSESLPCFSHGASHIAIGRNPGMADGHQNLKDVSNPYRCSAIDTPSDSGNFNCYDLLVVAAATNHVDNKNSAKWLEASQIKVRVERSSADAGVLPSVKEANFTSDWTKIVGTAGILSQDGKTNGNGHWEPTLTADGRLIGMGGGLYSYNFTVPFVLNGWSVADPCSINPKINGKACNLEARRLEKAHVDEANTYLDYTGGNTGLATSNCASTAASYGSPSVDAKGGKTTCIAGAYNSCPQGHFCVAFSDLYSFAKNPATDAEGFKCGVDLDSNGKIHHCFGGYVWFSQDGSDVFFTKATIPLSGSASPRSTWMILGAHTGWFEHHLDGAINSKRFSSIGHSTSPGFTAGMWAPFSDSSSIPFTRSTGVYPVYAASKYDEVRFDDTSDGNYLFYLHMNELVSGGSLGSHEKTLSACLGDSIPGISLVADRVSATVTPDTSGYFRNGTLSSGAVFPMERLYPNPKKGAPDCYTSIDNVSDTNTEKEQNDGFVGRSISFPPGGKISISLANHPLLSGVSGIDHWSISFALALEADPSKGELQLFKYGTSFSIKLNPQGALVITSAGLTATSTPLDCKINSSYSAQGFDGTYWCPITVTSNGVLTKIYVNGILKSSINAKMLFPSAISDLFEIGPGSGAAVGSSGYTYRLDEIALSNVERSPAEIARLAYATPSATLVADPNTLPSALPSELAPMTGGAFARNDLRVPAAVVPFLSSTNAAFDFHSLVTLGKDLFNDSNLAGKTVDVNGAKQWKGTGVSCSSCHNNSVLSEGKNHGKSFGVNSTPTLRNAPMLLNRAFSVSQFFDGRAPTLFDQVLLPLNNKDEMGGTTTASLIFLKTNRMNSNHYLVRFESIFKFKTFKLSSTLADLNLSSPDSDWTFALQAALTAYLLSQQSRLSVGQQLLAGLPLSGSPPSDIDSIRAGAKIFAERGHCINCHQGPNLTDELFHDTGVTRIQDQGRFNFTQRASDEYKFKTPSLTEVCQSAPYFHDGSKDTLDEVVDFYNSGGTHYPDNEISPLGLTDGEKADLVAFLKSLSSSACP